MSLQTDRYLLLGQSGDGKSTTANRLLQKECCKVSDAAAGCTQDPETFENTIGSTKVIVTDTAGFSDPKLNSNTTVDKIAEHLQKDQKAPINHVLVLQNGQLPRLRDDTINIIHMIFNGFKKRHPKITLLLTFLHPDDQKATQRKESYKKVLIEQFKEKASEINIECIENGPVDQSPIPQSICPNRNNIPPGVPPYEFSPDGFGIKKVEETTTHTKYHNDDGNVYVEITVKMKRFNIIPYTNKDSHYTEWEEIPGTEKRYETITETEQFQDPENPTALQDFITGTKQRKVKYEVLSNYKRVPMNHTKWETVQSSIIKYKKSEETRWQEKMVDRYTKGVFVNDTYTTYEIWQERRIGTESSRGYKSYTDWAEVPGTRRRKTTRTSGGPTGFGIFCGLIPGVNLVTTVPAAIHQELRND